MATRTPPPSQPSSFTEHLQDIREDLIDSGMYLGDIHNAFRREVTWRHVGYGKKILVTKESASAVDAKRQADAIATATVPEDFASVKSEDENRADSRSASVSSTVTDSSDEAGTELVPAQLSVVLQCSRGSWLTPCDFWNGPTEDGFEKKFADLKISVVGDRPPHNFQPFYDDFRVVRENVAWLMNQVKVRGAACKGFAVQDDSANLSALRFRHKLFEVSSFGSPPGNA